MRDNLRFRNLDEFRDPRLVGLTVLDERVDTV